MNSRSTHPTSTAEWSLAIHRVTRTSVEVWVGTLFPTLKMPERACVWLFDGKRKLQRIIHREEWRRPFSGMKRRFFFVATFSELTPGQDYRVEFERRVEVNAMTGTARHWQRLRVGQFRTLPSRLPSAGEGTFTIGLGSCPFYNHRDGGRAAAAYKAPRRTWPGRPARWTTSRTNAPAVVSSCRPGGGACCRPIPGGGRGSTS